MIIAETKKFGEWDPSLAAPFVGNFEGCRLTAYRCPAGVWTIGYGHTGKGVREGLEITQMEADALLIDDLARHQRAIADLIRVPVSENQFIAVLSLAFNIGATAFRRSSVLKNLNNGAPLQAAESFLLWNTVGGKPNRGLTRRRNAERRLFLKG
jgi:lysozyme